MANVKIVGVENMSPDELNEAINKGGRFVVYLWCVSILVMTFKRGTDIYFIPPGQNSVVKGLPWTLLSFIVGWWGFPWGLIYTPQALYTNLSGGKDVTAEVLDAMGPSARGLPDNPW